MMLKTSSRKINPFWNMIGFSLRKNLGIIVVLCIAALLYCPGSFIVNYEDWVQTYQNGYNDNYILENFATTVAVIAALAAVFFNMINFSFLYKKSSSDVFHAFPLRRSELLLSRLLSGLAATLIPVLVCYVSFGIFAAFNTWMGSALQLLYYLLHTVIIMLVCSTYSLIFVISAGSMFDLGVSLIGANLALLAVGWIFETVLSETLIGYNEYAASDIMYNISPPYFCAVGLSAADSVTEYGIKGSSVSFFIRSVIYIVLFTAGSLLLYNRRKAEKSGTAYAYKFMYLGCSVLAGICGGFLLGMMFNSSITSFSFWLFAIIGALLTAVIYGTVTNRGFKGIGHSLMTGGAAAVILIAVAVIGTTGGFGYTTRIPDTEKIKNVSVSAFGENIPFDNPEQAIALHKAIIDTNATDINYSLSYGNPGTVLFYYELENGKTMSRNYYIEMTKVSDELLAIYKSDERRDMINEHIDIVNTDETNLYFYYDNKYYSVDITKDETTALLDAYWQDVKDSDVYVFYNAGYNFIGISGYKKIDNNRENYFAFQLEYHDSFINTKQFVEANNILARAKEQ